MPEQIVEVATYGARRESYESGPRKLLQTIVSELGPDATKPTIEKEFLLRIEGNQEFITSIIKYWIENNLRLIRRVNVERDVKKEAETEKRIRERINRGILGVKLMSLQMPNGKLLGDCDRDDLDQMRPLIGKFLGRLTDQMAPGAKVREVFNEETLREIWTK